MIFYFSGTGNTEWAAKRIAEATNEELVFVHSGQDTNQYALKERERIGFCFPVHGWRPPFIFREFVRHLQIIRQGHHYCYALCTAGDNIGEAMEIFADDLKHTGLKLDSAFSLIMPESYVGLPFMDVDKQSKEKQKKETASKLLNTYIQNIVDRACVIKKLDIGNWPKINSRLLGAFFLKRLITDRYFKVDRSKCTRCGLCAKICPVADINGGKGKIPTWKHNGNCLTCFSCYHHCPTRAINFGMMTKGKGQYYYKNS